MALEKFYLTNTSIISDGYNVEKYVSNYASLISLSSNDVSVFKNQEVYATRIKFIFSYIEDWSNINLLILFSAQDSEEYFLKKYIYKFSDKIALYFR